MKDPTFRFDSSTVIGWAIVGAFLLALLWIGWELHRLVILMALS